MKNKAKNLISLGIILTGVIVGVNKVTDAMANRIDCLSDIGGKYYKWKYGNIYYTKTGNGKPLLLVHDLNVCSSSYEWNRVIKKLSADNTVYAIDLLGCGRSDKPCLTYTNYLYVQLINDFIREVIKSRTNVAATGYSFPVIVMACRMESNNYNKIIGVSPCDIYRLIKTTDKKRSILKHMMESPVVGTFFYNIDTNKKRIGNYAARNYFYKNQYISEEIVNSYYKGSKTDHSHGKYLLASIRSCFTNINIIPAIEKINNSICLIGGREQPFIHDIMDEYKAHNSSIEEAYISNACYLPQLESPENFIKLMQILL